MKFREVILVWRHINNLHMGPSSTKQRVGNVEAVESSKEFIKSTVEKKDKNTVRGELCTDIVIHRNKIKYNTRTVYSVRPK